MQIYCVECKQDVEAEAITGKEAYPHRKDLYNLKFYKCPKCNNFVGTHKGTNIPLGCIPNKELKQRRMQIHSIMDRLWKEGRIKRGELYKQISSKIGHEYHTGNTKSIEECKQILDIVIEIENSLKENKKWKKLITQK